MHGDSHTVGHSHVSSPVGLSSSHVLPTGTWLHAGLGTVTAAPAWRAAGARQEAGGGPVARGSFVLGEVGAGRDERRTE